MKRIMFIISILLVTGSLTAQKSTTDLTTTKTKLDVYYTHSTNRCPGCKAIEKETLETLNKDFKIQLDRGEIVTHIINIDLKASQQFVDKYEVWGSSLFIVKNGDKKNRVDLTKEGFATARSKPEVFRTKLTETLNKLLK